MFKKVKYIRYEKVDDTPHPDYEVHNTSVAEYFRKYSAGKSDMMPTDSRPEVTDDRSEDEMLGDESKINHMACDELDVLQEMSDNLEKFNAALKDIELTKKQREQFISATKLLEDPNATTDQKREAYELIEELHDKVTRARKF